MNTVTMRAAMGLWLAVALAMPACASSERTRSGEEARVKESTQQVESGAKTAGEGIKETAKGVGNTVAEGAKATGDRFKDAGHEAEPQVKGAWEQFKDGASSFGHGVKDFFKTLFGS